MSLEYDQHLQLFNPPLQVQSHCDRFIPFQRLALELRYSIWEYALSPQERLLEIWLCHPVRAMDAAESSSANPNACGEESYHVICEGRNLIPKLLHVCREARQVALKIYRVQLPCRYKFEGSITDSVLYLCPELDILRMIVDRGSDFFDFVQDLKARDPNSIGLLNLALIRNTLHRIEEVDQATRSVAFRTILSGLKQVIFLCLESQGRTNHGLLGGIMAIQGFEMHRSRPVMGSIPSFQRLPQDPRSIEKDLTRVYMGTGDPREMVFRWKMMLQRCQTQLSPDVRYQFLISCKSLFGVKKPIFDRMSAKEAIQNEHVRWLAELDKWEQLVGREHVQRESPEQLQLAPPSVVGFWLFPLEALGDIPSPEHHDITAVAHLFQPKRVEDLSKYRPELGVFSLVD